MRRLQFVGPLLAIYLALAVTAPSALAGAGFEAEEFPATISGTQEGTVVFKQDSLEVVCESSSLTASMTAASEATETLTATPTYSKCTSAGKEMTVTATGCSYVLHAGSETSTNVFTGELDVSCSAEKAIKISGRNCESKIETQSKLSGLSNTDNLGSSPQNFTLKLTPTKMKYNKTKDGEGCPFTGTGVKEDGTLTQTETEKGTDEEAQGDGAILVRATKVCKANEATCSAENTYGKNTVIEASATDGRFKAEGLVEGKMFSIEIKCSEASIVASTNDITGHPRLQVSTSSFSFQKCTAVGGKACTVSALETPYTSQLVNTPNGNGMNLIVNNVSFNCEEPEFICKYGNTAGAQALPASGGSPLVLTKGTGFGGNGIFRHTIAEEKNCPQNMEWSATYTVTKPTAIWITY
jgi:hypothetical protein